MPFLNYKPLKLLLRVVLAGPTVAIVTYCVMKRTTTCSLIVGKFFDTMIVASSDKEWLQSPIKILVLETVFSHLLVGILKLTIRRGHSNLNIVFFLASCEEKGYDRVVLVGQVSFDCRSYCGLSHRM